MAATKGSGRDPEVCVTMSILLNKVHNIPPESSTALIIFSTQYKLAVVTTVPADIQ
jgi:hypothetical protein